ncbi:hypothetical protein [Pseudooceanicola aestuarii]|uniref:hypothetical protein n=1 Tax=Pseudooceanicola aestuarii TaxID=2697319 RepID=UPI0013CFE51B|nr:hypothetical protein [Pseudooceanicola aestuarii]
MPHIVLEHGGLDVDIGAICRGLRAALAADPRVPEDIVKVRAYGTREFALGPEYTGFAHVTLRLLDKRGRDEHMSHATLLRDLLQDHLPAGTAISVETVTIASDSFRKT